MEKTTMKAFGTAKNWWNNTAIPFIRDYVFVAVDAFVKSVTKALKISWVSFLCLFCLYYLSKNGYLDEVPSIKWLVESTVRLIDWFFGVVQDFLGFSVNSNLSPFVFLQPIKDWLKHIFAI